MPQPLEKWNASARVQRYQPGTNNSREEPPNGGYDIMFSLLIVGIFGAMASLIIYELVVESQGSSHKLTDRYHE